ncbi:MAG: glutamate racemase [Janthinobacterium lividum]
MSAGSPSLRQADAPIGVFDSGVGGLSVLRHIRALLPHERLLYAADAGFAPYGERSEAQLVERSLVVAGFLIAHGVKAIVVACNTATAAAVTALRARYPELILVGVEPGLKPAALSTNSRIVGVLATASTLASARFMTLQRQVELAFDVRFITQACNGLAAAIENGDLSSPATADMVTSYVTPLVSKGADVLVLGCTHYPFVLPLVSAAAMQAPGPVAIIDTGAAVARQLQRLLTRHSLERAHGQPGTLSGHTSGSEQALRSAFFNLLGVQAQVAGLSPAAVGA